MTTLRDISAEDSASYYGEAQRLHWRNATASARLEATDPPSPTPQSFY